MKTALVTGAGFIGNAITERLVQMGVEVTVILSGGETTSSGVKKVIHTGLHGIDKKYLLDHAPYDVIFHQMANNDTLSTDTEEMWWANVQGPTALFSRLIQAGCGNIVYASSTAVYGNSQAPYKETTALEPLNAYAKSKLEFDQTMQFYAFGLPIRITGLRYCNVYGKGEENKGKRMSMIGQLLRKMNKGQQPRIFEDGEQRRDWVHIDDVVNANILAATRKTWGFEIFNIGSGRSYTFNEVVATINEVLGSSLETQYITNFCKDTYQTYTECDITKAGEHLNFKPMFDLRTGIEEYLKCL